MELTLQMLSVFAGAGLLWGLVITSVPYSFLLHRYKLTEIDVLECALCTGSWIALMMSMKYGFHPMTFAALPLLAEFVSRWIRR